MSKALDTGKSFLSGVLAKLPETLRNKPLSEIVAAAEASEALTYAGDATLARADYSRLADELKAKETAVLADHQKLTDWWEEHKDYDELKKKADGISSPNPNPALSADLDKKYIGVADFNRTVDELQQGGVRYFNAMAKLVATHQARFHEVLDPDELVAIANQRKISIHDAYKEKYGEQIATADKAAEEARINKLVEDRLAEERRAHPQPFPLRNQAPSVLDELDKPDRKPIDVVQAAVDEYERLQAARG